MICLQQLLPFKDSSRATFEITETALISNMPTTREAMQHLRTAGFGFALDDFGAGFSSFSYLKDFIAVSAARVKVIKSLYDKQRFRREYVKRGCIESLWQTRPPASSETRLAAYALTPFDA